MISPPSVKPEEIIGLHYVRNSVCYTCFFFLLFLAMLSHVWTKVSRKLLYKDLQIKVDFRHDWLTFLRVIAFCSKNRFADFSLLCFHISEWKVRLAYLWRTLLLQSSGSVPFGTCICCNVETFHSLTCRVHGPFEFRTYLGILILLCSTLSYEVQNK